MALFGSSWLDDSRVDDHESIFSRKYKSDESYDYYLDEHGEYQKVTTLGEKKRAEESGNLFSYDGKKYEKKQP